MDRFQSMTAFLAVVDTGGFASAARRLKVSPSVVTRAVSDLEERLGVRLLTRTTRFVRVTIAPSWETSIAASPNLQFAFFNFQFSMFGHKRWNSSAHTHDAR